jgi:hypothetical protein
VKNIDRKDIGEFIIETLAFRYIRWWLAATGTTYYALRDVGIIQSPKKKDIPSSISVVPPAPGA